MDRGAAREWVKRAEELVSRERGVAGDPCSRSIFADRLLDASRILEEALNRAEALEEALRFYADESIYDYSPDGSGADSRAESDRGGRARFALEEDAKRAKRERS